MADGSLVVLTQNAWGGAPLWPQRRDRLARAMLERAPDVIGLQEIHAPTPSGEGSQAHELAARMDGYDAWFAPGRVTASGHAEGVALMVNRTSAVLERTVQKLSLDAQDPLEGPHQRVVLRAALRHDGQIVDAFVTHLSLSKPARERTLAELRAFAAARRGDSGSAGAVLVGDFNATPPEPALAALAASGWTDAWSHTSPEARGGTWPSAAPFRRIDYVWVQPGDGWRIESCVRLPVSGSDHVGLVATIRF